MKRRKKARKGSRRRTSRTPVGRVRKGWKKIRKGVGKRTWKKVTHKRRTKRATKRKRTTKRRSSRRMSVRIRRNPSSKVRFRMSDLYR